MSESESPRLLVMTYHFPPDNSVGGLRWWGLSRYLLERGWSIRVISAQKTPGRLHEGDFEVRSAPPKPTMNDSYRAWRLRRGRSAGSGGDQFHEGAAEGAGPASRKLLPSRILGALRREMAALMSFPDTGWGWVEPAGRLARDVVDEFDPHVVVSSGPPHSVHLAARRALNGRRARWLMDMRDPWGDAQGSTRLTAWLHGRLEARCVAEAAGVLTTTPELRDLLQDRYPDTPVHWLSNGVDPADLPAEPGARSNGFVLSHVGTVYWKRDPRPILQGVARFLERTPEAREGFRLIFVGSVSGEYASMIDEVRGNGMAPDVTMMGRVPRADALEILSASSVAVILAQDQGLMVPAKIYESVGLGVPTLAITEPGSATHAAARRLGAEVGDPGDPGDVAEALARMWRDRDQERRPPPEVGYDHLAGMADALLGGGRGGN